MLECNISVDNLLGWIHTDGPTVYGSALKRYEAAAMTCEGCERDLSATDWAYLAGIFDGEGSVHLTSARNKQGKLKTFQLCATVVCGTNRRAIDEIAKMIGRHGNATPTGHGRKLEPINGKGSRRQAWRLRLYSGHASWFLNGVFPFLLMKVAQADLGIEHQRGKYRGMRCDEVRLNKETSAKRRLTALNMRGVE